MVVTLSPPFGDTSMSPARHNQPDIVEHRAEAAHAPTRPVVNGNLAAAYRVLNDGDTT